MADPLGEAAALVSVPSSKEGIFVTNNLTVKSGATFQNAVLNAPDREPDDDDKWADPLSATKSLSHPIEDSLDDDEDIKEGEERAAGSALTLNGPDVSCENAKTTQIFETRADENIENKEIERTVFQRSRSCPDNESLDIAPIKRSNSSPSTLGNVGIEQEQERLGSRLNKTTQASHLGPKSSSLYAYGPNQDFGHLQKTPMANCNATNNVEGEQLDKEAAPEKSGHGVVSKLALEKVPREVEELSLRTAQVLHEKPSLPRNSDVTKPLAPPEQCTDSDASKSYFNGFHDQSYAGIFPKSFLQSYFNEQRYASILAKSISTSVYSFDGFRDMDRYQKFCPFYYIYFVTEEVQTIDFKAMKEISRNEVYYYSYGKYRIKKTEYDKERLNMIYPLNTPNIDRLLAVVLEDPNSSNMCFEVTEEPTGTLDSVLSGIGASDGGFLRFITTMCPRDRRNIAFNFLCSFKDVLLAGKYLVSSGLYHKAITGKNILVMQKCKCLTFLSCDCFVASKRKWIATLSESMCIIRHSDDILCLSNDTNNTGAALIEQRTSDDIDSNFRSTCELYRYILFGRNIRRAFNILTVDVFEQDDYMRRLRRLGVELLEPDCNTRDYYIAIIEEV